MREEGGREMDVEIRLRELGMVLPKAPEPIGNYKAFVRAGALVFISGQIPLVNGALIWQGRIGAELTAEQGYQAARACALNVLAQLKKALGGFDRLRTVARVDGYVNAAPGFHDLARVLDGASDLLAAALVERSGHSRTVAAHSGLPMNAAVELGVIAEVECEIEPNGG
jgi:enamine deaminase RidA (YjgF/YER057c/UK114 family)